MSKDWTPREFVIADKIGGITKTKQVMTVSLGEGKTESVVFYDPDSDMSRRYHWLSYLVDDFSKELWVSANKNSAFAARLSQVELYVESLANATMEGKPYPNVPEPIRSWFTGKLDPGFYYNERNTGLFVNIFKQPLINYRDLVLEGGSIETDGNGTVMTTTCCLTAPNRNDTYTREQLETELLRRLGCLKMLWLDYGELTGDDTDGHIDTLARFAPGGVILYTGCDDTEDEHFEPLMKMEEQLKQFTDVDGNHYHLIKLPLPDALYDEISRLPATYANFLITNHQVLVPIYGQPEKDVKACELIGQAFPGRKVVGIDCRALICQHGSLHCATMQLPQGSLSCPTSNQQEQ